MVFNQTKQGFTPLFVIPSTQAHVTPQGFCAGYKSFFVAPLYPALRHCGMTSGGVSGMTSAARGFTLIELLVVVLIIGVLAAVALPQYQVAVLKSRAVQAITSLNALEKAQEVYKLANGSYASDLKDLDVDVSGIIGASDGSYAQKRINNSFVFEWVWVSTGFPQGQHRCIASEPVAHKVCKSLGGEKIDHSNNTDTTTYYKIP